MDTPRSRRGRILTYAIAGGLALVGVLGVGGSAQALLAGPAVQDVADDSGSDSKPKPDCDRVCEK